MPELPEVEITPALFSNHLRRKKSAIKTVLLDQSVVAGIGNWIADDVLFRAKIHPETPASTLDETEIMRIVEAMRYIVQTTIDVEANYLLLPDDFILHARGWGKPHLAGKCPCGKGEILMSRVGGRATYFCGWCQSKK